MELLTQSTTKKDYITGFFNVCCCSWLFLPGFSGFAGVERCCM
jgi:hypothetical protein